MPTSLERPAAREREESLYGDPLAPGAAVGKYRVEELVGSGGFATVYRARHFKLARQAAIKVLHPDIARSAKMVRRFEREADAVNRIGHANIADIFDIGSLPDGRPFVVMEWIDGQDLESLIEDVGSLTPEEAVEMAEQVLPALGAAHELGIVHRDVKSANVMVSLGAATRVYKLIDFGIVKLIGPRSSDAGITSTGVRVGSPISMAPEQIRGGEVSARTDLYGFGVLLFEVLTASLPFQSDSVADLEEQHLLAPPPHPRDLAPLPEALDRVVVRCLAKRPEDRYEDAAELLVALRRAVHG